VKPVDLAELQQSIVIQLRVLRGPVKTALQNLRGDQAAEAAAQLIIERCLSGFAIYAPDRVRITPHPQWSHGTSAHGRFGVTEPWPRPPVEPAHPDRCRLCTINDIDGLGEALARAMWDALVPATPFEKAGEHRASFLLIAHRAINWLRRAQASDS
jgi:hypothetical protein